MAEDGIFFFLVGGGGGGEGRDHGLMSKSTAMAVIQYIYSVHLLWLVPVNSTS